MTKLNKEKAEKDIVEQNEKLFKNFKDKKIANNFLVDISKYKRPDYDKVLLFGINPGEDKSKKERKSFRRFT